MPCLIVSIAVVILSSFVPAAVSLRVRFPSSSALCFVSTKSCKTAGLPVRTPLYQRRPVEVSAASVADKVDDSRKEPLLSGGSVEGVVEILRHENESPTGSLGELEILSIRNAISDLIGQSRSMNAENDIDRTLVAESCERRFYRLIREWEAVCLNGTDTELSHLLQPKDEDFRKIMEAWEMATFSYDVWNTTVYGGASASSDQGRAPKRVSQALPTAVDHAIGLFEDQKRLAAKWRIDSIRPSSETFRVLLRLMAAAPREKNMDQGVWSLFQKLKYDEVVVDADMYSSIILSQAKSRHRHAAARSEKILREALAIFPPLLDSNGRNTGIGIDSFNTVITAWAKCSFSTGPDRAQALIVYMEELAAKYGNHVQPNVQSFTSLIDAYAQTNEWEGVGQSERILNRLLDHYLGDRTTENDESDTTRRLFEPNIASWTIVISAWGRLARKNRRGAAARAGKLLRRLEDLSRAGRISFSPDAIAYVTVLNAYAYDRSDEGSQMAVEILNEMNEQYLDGNDSMKPSARTLRVVIESLIKGKDATSVLQAESILRQFSDTLAVPASQEDNQNSKMSLSGVGHRVEGAVDHVSDIYRSMVFGWCKNGSPQRALDYLEIMLKNRLTPDSLSLERVIEASIQLNDDRSLQRSTQVMELAEQFFRQGFCQPNERLYASYIRALTNAKVPCLAKRAYGVISDCRSFVEPTIYSYNAVLYACAESWQLLEEDQKAKDEAFRVALTVFNEMRSATSAENMTPDSITFGNLLRCAKLMSPEGGSKDGFISTTFQLCCRRGLVNKFVIRDLQYAASESPELLQSLIPPRAIITGADLAESSNADFLLVDIDRLPSSWSRSLVSRTN
jgi:pentatricopeptide repeat protein